VLLAVLTVVWLAAVVAFLTWWFGQDGLGPNAGSVVSSVVLVLHVLVLPSWFFLLANRARRPAPGLRPPDDVRVAMVVTKAPSEPWPMLRRTLEAMLAQELDRPFDVWLADEDPTPATLRWCHEHGVGVSTRRDAGPDYHRDTWPRRRRCKEGNLAYFYDVFGYERYDVVSQLDADHVPAPDYLQHVIAPFADPRVGYVAAPSMCDLNAPTSWAARGRLHDEGIFHGVMQAGTGGGWAPSCIGSHYAVRTAAVRGIGGLGPDLAEDFSTSLLLSAAGWDGAFAIDAEAHGRGPDTVADCVTQDLQWSRSMVTLLLTVGPGAWRRLTVRRKARLGFCLAWYPLVSALFVVTHAMPLWALVQGGPLVAVDLLGFLLHVVAVEAVVLAAILLLRRAGTLRPRDAPIVSWEMLLFRFIRWPWMVVGCVTALYVVVTKRTLEWKVTPKGVDAQGRPLDLRVVVFPLLIVAAFALPVLLVPHPAAAGGYFLWAVTGACVYAFVAACVVILHRRENPRADGLLARRGSLLTAGPVTSAVVVLTVLMVVVQGPASVRGAGFGGPSTAMAAPPERPPALRRLGVSVGGLSQDESTAFAPSMLGDAATFERAAGARPGVVTWFSDWVQPPPRMDRLRAIEAYGATPQITWEPRDHRAGRKQRRFRLDRIHRGDFDAYATAWARRLADYGGPVLLRFAHEMNHHAYPWGTAEGNRPGTYVSAWRHLRAVFARAGATNVQWVWSPTASHLDWRYYPGDDVVDVIGLTGFNGGSELRWAGWRSPTTIYEDALRQIRRRTPTMPVEISEVSSAPSGGDRPAWIAELFRLVRRHPQVTTLNWFNLDKQADWRLKPGSPEADAFRRGLATWEVDAPTCPTARLRPVTATRPVPGCAPAAEGAGALAPAADGIDVPVPAAPGSADPLALPAADRGTALSGRSRR
jgi:cellulose synthase (UDP-forming)